MRGAIAAGHPVTAAVGARVLEQGGTAVDACIAAAAASWVAESPLTGPAAGGFLLVHEAEGPTRLLDFFVAVPGLGSDRRKHVQMERIDIPFGPESTQAFRIGTASCAVPGVVSGLEAAHQRFGLLPWRELLAPAVELARGGVEITPAQGHMHALLDLILRHTDEGRRMYGNDGDRLVTGDTLRLPDLADTLELISRKGAKAFYGGDLGHELVRFLRANGGRITEQDLRAYRVIWRRPVIGRYRGREFLSNPPPSSGGVLIAYGLSLLDRLGEGGKPGGEEAVLRLIEVMREQTRTRQGRFVSDLERGGLAKRLLANGRLDEAAARVRSGVPGLPDAGRPTGTTHISVVDSLGNAASLTASLGSGSGVILPGTGIHLNNMLGEYDLVAGNERPGARLTSMMAPSLVLEKGRPRLVVGSAGSVRLRGAIMQTVVNVVGHGMGVDEAVSAPRVHVDEPVVHCEGGDGVDPTLVERLEGRGYEVTRWRKRNLFFGGVGAVELLPDGSLAAAGDPRRGGAGLVVG